MKNIEDKIQQEIFEKVSVSNEGYLIGRIPAADAIYKLFEDEMKERDEKIKQLQEDIKRLEVELATEQKLSEIEKPKPTEAKLDIYYWPSGKEKKFKKDDRLRTLRGIGTIESGTEIIVIDESPENQWYRCRLIDSDHWELFTDEELIKIND